MLDSDALREEIPRLRRYARALTGERGAADDLVQDTLERAWSRRGQWHPGRELRPWLFGIMHNLRVDQLRRTGPAPLSFDEGNYDPPVRATQADGLELNDLEAALGALPEEQRAVLLLVALEDMSYEEVAGTMGIPAGTVMSRLARGRERLRAILAGGRPAASLRVVK